MTGASINITGCDIKNNNGDHLFGGLRIDDDSGTVNIGGNDANDITNFNTICGNKINGVATIDNQIISSNNYPYNYISADCSGYQPTKKVHNITQEKDYDTIQSAIDGSLSGDEIVVFPGIYNERINFMGKNITLRSTNPSDPNVVASTIIDGLGLNGAVVVFKNSETINAVIKGFTIQNGNNWTGAGIFIRESSPSIIGNIITGNYADVAGEGGGLFIYQHSRPTISGNTITGNEAYNRGGGIYIGWSSDPIITSNIISNNTATWGGGIYVCEDSSATVTYNVITNNKGGIYVDIDSNLLPANERPTGWGNRKNIPIGDPLVPKENELYIIAENEFIGNKRGNPLEYKEGAHVLFQKY
jgi:parallel beta-helix repeat protein